MKIEKFKLSNKKRMKNLLSSFIRCFSRPKYCFDKLISGPGWKQLITLSFLFIFIFGIWYGASLGLDKKKIKINRDIESLGWSILAQMIDPGNQHMVETPKGTYKTETFSMPEAVNWKYRLFVFFISLTGTIVFSGLLISTFTNIFNRRIEKINEGLVNYKFKNHFIVIGFDFMTIGLIKQLLQKEKDCWILIHTVQNIPIVRQKLFSQLPNKAEKRIIILNGARDIEEEIKRLSLKKAKDIFILGEPDEYDHDSRNIVCAKLINEHLKNNSSEIKNCHILFKNPTTYMAFQFLNINDQDLQNINLISLNYYEQWAQKVFEAKTYQTQSSAEKDIEYFPLDYRENIISEEDSRFVHLVVVGMTRMGIAMAIEAARLGHFANHQKKKTKITFIDTIAVKKEQQFANCYSTFYDAIDVTRENSFTKKKMFTPGKLPFINIEMEFITGEIESPEVRKKLSQWATDKSQILTIAICFNYPPFSLSQGMFLPKEVYENEIPVLIRQESSYAIVNLLCEIPNVVNKYKCIKPFGMVDDCLDLTGDNIAKYINHFYWNCDKKNISFPRVDIENEWSGLKERDKWSNRFNVNSFKTKIRAIQWDGVSEFTSEEIELLARMEHARWNTERLIAGFTIAAKSEVDESTSTANLAWEDYIQSECDHENSSYKKKKTIHEKYVKELKTKMIHPCIIPYDELSEYYKNIDKQLVKSIPKILKLINEEERR